MSIRHHPLVAATLATFPGAEITDMRDVPPDRGTAWQSPRPGPKLFSLADVRATLTAEADRIRTVQDRLVREGDRNGPDAGQMLAADHFDAAATLIDKCKADPVIMDRLKKGPAP